MVLKMYKTVQIFRGLLNVRNCNRVITSKYCVFHKGGNDSGEKDGTPSETGHKSIAETNKISESEINAKELKHDDGIKLSSQNEVTASNESVKRVESANFGSASGKVEPGKNEPESRVSSVEDSTGENEKLQKEKPEQLSQSSKIKAGSESGSSVKEKLKHHRKGSEAEKAKNDSFAALLRNSAFIDLGDPVNKLVIGEIYLVVDDDLYIDFGWKFPAICPRPKVNSRCYNIGAKVLLRIKDLELTASFLGDKEYTSLLEADCELLYRVNEDGSKYVPPQSERKTSSFKTKTSSEAG